jgi:hypothetical protein
VLVAQKTRLHAQQLLEATVLLDHPHQSAFYVLSTRTASEAPHGRRSALLRQDIIVQSVLQLQQV